MMLYSFHKFISESIDVEELMDLKHLFDIGLLDTPEVIPYYQYFAKTSGVLEKMPIANGASDFLFHSRQNTEGKEKQPIEVIKKFLEWTGIFGEKISKAQGFLDDGGFDLNLTISTGAITNIKTYQIGYFGVIYEANCRLGKNTWELSPDEVSQIVNDASNNSTWTPDVLINIVFALLDKIIPESTMLAIDQNMEKRTAIKESNESDEKTSTEDFDFLYEHGLIGLSEYYDATKSLPGIEPSTELRLDGQDLIGFGVSDFLEQTLSNLMWSDWAGYSADEILAFLSIAFGPYSADERLERLKDSVYVLLDRVLLVPGRGVVLFIQIYSYYGPERRYDALLRYNGYELDELQLEAGQKTRFLEALHQTFENRNRQK